MIVLLLIAYRFPHIDVVKTMSSNRMILSGLISDISIEKIYNINLPHCGLFSGDELFIL